MKPLLLLLAHLAALIVARPMTDSDPSSYTSLIQPAQQANPAQTAADNGCQGQNGQNCIWQKLLNLGLVRQTTKIPSIYKKKEEDQAVESRKRPETEVRNSIETGFPAKTSFPAKGAETEVEGRGFRRKSGGNRKSASPSRRNGGKFKPDCWSDEREVDPEKSAGCIWNLYSERKK